LVGTIDRYSILYDWNQREKELGLKDEAAAKQPLSGKGAVQS
jgi:hypothetical protein